MDGGHKTSDWANCKGHLALTVRDERRFRRIVRSQRIQTLAQITTQLNGGSSLTVSKRTVQRSLDHYLFACPLTKDFHLVSPSQNTKKNCFQSIVGNPSIHSKLKSCIKIAYSIRDQIP
ncbi:hypothetical protein TNCV_2970431 [Trichonephila clavipes]|nr:hypothetical protein TNCV_2970431 [Trichonephila clavipes]